MSLLLFDAYLGGVVQEVNARFLEKRLELLFANGGRLETNRCYLQMIRQ